MTLDKAAVALFSYLFPLYHQESLYFIHCAESNSTCRRLCIYPCNLTFIIISYEKERNLR